MKSLNETTSVGSDGTSMKFIKDALYIIASYLTCIVNTSIVTGNVPTAWKDALVIPPFKSGDVSDFNHFRLISVLPIISKVLDKIVANQLTHILETKKLLPNSQHRFRPKLSTEAALTVITDKIYNNMDSKKNSILTLCDLSKAFDSVSHMILLNKCALLNTDSFWFESYLSDRTQSVRLSQKLSDRLNVSYGVPQGSVLGPILFSIYVMILLKELIHAALYNILTIPNFSMLTQSII